MPFRRALLGATLTALVLAAPAAAAERARLYQVDGARSVLDRSSIAARGAAIVEADHGYVVAGMTRREARAVRRLGYRVVRLRAQRVARGGGPRARASGFPAADAAYHDYAETVNELTSVANAYPAIVQRVSLGTSHEGRTVYALKVSDNVGTDEAEPEVLFTANQHAREHLTVEMALYLLGELTSKYATDARVRSAVDSPRDLDRPDGQPGRRRSTTSPPAPTARGARTASRTPDRPRSAPTSTATGATAGAAAAVRAGRPPPTTYRGASAFSAPETRDRARLREARA